MRRNLERIIIAIIILILVVPICYKKYMSPQNIMKRYAKKNNFGKVKLIDIKEDNGEYVATFEDKEYGFYFEVERYNASFELDGSTFFSYKDMKTTFKEKYLSVVKQKLEEDFNKLNNQYETSYNWNDDCSVHGEIIRIYTNKTEKIDEILLQYAKRLKKIDTRKYFENMKIGCYKTNGEDLLGKTVLYKDECSTAEDSEIEWAMNNAYVLMTSNMGMKIKDVKKLKYVETKIMDVNDIPGIENEELAYRLGDDTDESMKETKVFYYTYKGEKWIIADCIIKPNGNLYVYKLEK